MEMNEGGGKGKILVMDDDEMVRFIAGQTLEKIGYQVKFAEEGREALEAYRKAFADGEPFIAAILDLNIPGGMGGKETLDKLLEIDPNVKAYVSSGNSSDPAMLNHNKYGFFGVIEKPYFYLSKDLLDEFQKNIDPKE